MLSNEAQSFRRCKKSATRETCISAAVDQARGAEVNMIYFLLAFLFLSSLPRFLPTATPTDVG